MFSEAKAAALQLIETSHRRLETCNSCTQFYKKTQQCRLCHCWMPAKTKIPQSKCPQGKW